MPQVDLTTLKEHELRRLLGASRERGQAAQTYQILQEMAARREGGGAGLFRGRRPAEPRVIAVDLDGEAEAEVAEHTLDEDDIPPLPPGWVPQAPDPEAGAEPRPKGATPGPAKAKGRAAPRGKTPLRTPQPRPRRARKPAPTIAPVAEPAAQPVVETAGESRPEPRPLTSFRIEPPPQQQPPQPPRNLSPWLSRWSGLIFAGGAALGVAFGWWAGGTTRDLLQANPPPPVVAQAVASHVRPASRTLKPAPQAAALPAPGPADPTDVPPPSAAQFVRDAVATQTQPQPPSASPAPAATPPPDEPAAEAPETADAPPAHPLQIAPAPPGGCAAEPTPADRTICETPRLQQLQRQLRRAYAEALTAHRDRALLHQRQMAWAEARNGVADPERLARLYDERIRRLHAATAQARREHRRG